MYKHRDLSTSSAEAVETALKVMIAEEGYSADMQVRLANLPPSLAVVELQTGNVIVFHVPTDYPSAERRNFFTNRWLTTAQLFAIAKSRYSHSSGCCPLWLNDFPGGPGLAFCSNATGNVLIPDPEYLTSDGYAALRASAASGWIPWQSRRETISWRGASTGDRSQLGIRAWYELPRFRLCKMVNESDQNTMFDVGVSNIVQIGDAAEIAEIEKSGVIRDKVAPEWFMNYRHAIDIDGNANSWSGLFTKLIMGNTVLKVDSAGGYRQWYYDRLIPWENFIPISSTMAELFEVCYWLRAHPWRAKEIALAGNQLAASLTAESSLADAATAVVSAIGNWPNIDVARGVIPSARPAFSPVPEASRQTKEPSSTAPFITQTITQAEVPPAPDLVTRVRESFARASTDNSAIDPGVLKIHGMSETQIQKVYK